ncbi:ABC transporter ATPase [Staphylococcus agnetis]|nr:ABC transporter ATPase [Staphylococcus agnetis]
MGYVMQNSIMMNESIKNNILYGIDGKVSTRTLEYYSDLSNLHSFITQLPDKYNTEIGENGIKISGGQQQKINIARNLIKQPEILLLDEATANLDSESEKKYKMLYIKRLQIELQ